MATPHFVSGWRPSIYDPRDEAFAFKAAPHVLAAMPNTYDINKPALPAPYNPIWNQENIGSCGPHTTARDILGSAFRLQGLKNCPMPSRLYIYWITRYLMKTVNSDSGVDNRTMLKAIARYGWCDESLWPYDTSKFKVQPPQECFKQGATRQIKAYRAVKQDIDTMCACIAGGDSIIFGFVCYDNMFTPQVDKTGKIPMPLRNSKPSGGHDVALTAYDRQRGVFILDNSWGPEWGDNGRGEIPFEYAANPRLSSDFWTVEHSALPDVAPTPPEPPAPSPSGKKLFINLSVDLDTYKVETNSAVGESVNDPVEVAIEQVRMSSACNAALKEANNPTCAAMLNRLRGGTKWTASCSEFMCKNGWGKKSHYMDPANAALTPASVSDLISNYGMGISEVISQLIALNASGKLDLESAINVLLSHGVEWAKLVWDVCKMLGVRLPDWFTSLSSESPGSLSFAMKDES